jgi:hypothetical protein
MSEALEDSLSRAEERQREYDWLGAIECYKVALAVPAGATVPEKARIREKIGNAFFRSAMQAQSSDAFRRRCAKAVESFKAAMESYTNLASPLALGRVYRCEATIALLNCWLASNHSHRRSAVEACWKLTKKALKEFLLARESGEYGWTYNLLSTSAGFAFALQTDQREREIIVREAIGFGEDAIALLSESVDAW